MPATGLAAVIRIWQLGVSSDTMIVVDSAMVEVGDGFYKYDFTGYQNDQQYLFRTDGGVTMVTADRYQYGSVELATVDDATQDDIASKIWDVSSSDHLTAGTMGASMAMIKADTSTITVGVSLLQSLVDMMLKYQRNRTKIDPVTKQLIIYDDDCTTILHTFDLKDATGTPSITEVYERRPTTC